MLYNSLSLVLPPRLSNTQKVEFISELQKFISSSDVVVVGAVGIVVAVVVAVVVIAVGVSVSRNYSRRTCF